MKLKKLITLMTTSLVFTSGIALAEPFYINVNAFGGSPAGTNGTTANIYQLGVDWSATSTFTDDFGPTGLGVGDSVTDSGAGTVSSYLNNVGSAILGAENNEGVGVSHSLRFDYTNLAGKVGIYITNPLGPDGILARYTSGQIHVYNDNNLDSVLNGSEREVLTLDVFDSTGTVGNAIIFAKISYAETGIWFLLPNTDWASSIVAINARIDTNVDAITDPMQVGTTNVHTRGATFNGSLGVNRIPEPTSIALLGLGLLGLGLRSSHRKAV